MWMRSGASVKNSYDDVSVFLERTNVQESMTALVRGLQRIVEDLGTHLEQLIGVRHDERQFRRELNQHFDLQRPTQGLGEFDGRAQHGPKVNRVHGGGALPGEIEQAGHQRSGTTDLLADSGGKLLLIGRKLCIRQQVGVTEHGGDGIVEFVSGAAHQLADGCQLFGFGDLRLQALQVGVRLLRLGQQAKQFAIQQTLSQENQGAHVKRRSQG